MHFGKRLEALIKYRNTNVNRLSKKTGISPQTLYMMIKRDSNGTDMTTMGLLATALDVNISYFYDNKYEIDENGNISVIEAKRTSYLIQEYITGRITIKKELMNLLYFIADSIIHITPGKLFPTDALAYALTANFRLIFDKEFIPIWEQQYVYVEHSFVEYPDFYLVALKIKYSRCYIDPVSDFLQENHMSEDELVEYIYKSMLQNYVNLHLKDHILYNAPCIKELVDWKAPFLQRKEE